MISAPEATKAHQDYYYPVADKKNWTSKNIGQTERWLSALGGGILASYGLARRGWSGITLALAGGSLIYRGVSGHSFLFQATDIVTAEHSPSAVASLPDQRGIRVRRSLTIRRSPQYLYTSWRQLEQAPRYMPNIESVVQTGKQTSHWTATGPFGRSIEWDAQLVQDIPGQLIAWETQDKSTIGNAGSVTFKSAPADRGTVVTLQMDFPLLQGPLGSSIGQLLGNVPEQLIQKSLRQFKELMETGEIATTKGQPTGQGRS